VIRDLIEGVTGYPGLFTFCVLSGILVPVPEDVPLIYAGIRIANSEWAWVPTLIVAISGVFIRDMLAFGMGRWLGERILTESHRFARWAGPKKVERARSLFERHDVGAIFLGRLFIGFRVPVFLVAGALGVPVRRFAVWNMAALILTVPLILVLGYVIGQPMADLVLLVSKRGREVAVVLMGLTAFFFGWNFIKSRWA
jgi:undecaprenyl-diphosphatase